MYNDLSVHYNHVIEATCHVIVHLHSAFGSTSWLNFTYLECDFFVSEGNAARGRVIAEPSQSMQQRGQIGFVHASEQQVFVLLGVHVSRSTVSSRHDLFLLSHAAWFTDYTLVRRYARPPTEKLMGVSRQYTTPLNGIIRC